MGRHNTNDLPDEIKKRIEDGYQELQKLQGLRQYAAGRERSLKADLKYSFLQLGINEGDSLEAPDLGVYARLARHATGHLDRDTLRSLGVSEAILDQAVSNKYTEPYLRFGRIKKAQEEDTLQEITL